MPFSASANVISTDLDNMLRGQKQDNSNYAVTGGVVETDMASFTMASNTMGATGALHVVAAGTITGAAGTKRIRLYFGATAIVDTTAAAGVADWWIDCWIYNTSASAQRIVGTWSDHQTATNFNKDYITAAIATTSSVIIKLTGILGNAADTITETIFDVLIIQSV